MRIYIVFFIIAIPQFIFAQEYQPVACPLGQEQTILNLPKPGAGKLSNAENDIRAFVRDSLQSVVNRKFISHSQRYFSIKKVPDAAIYRIDYHPYDAYTAIKGRDTARVLTLYLFLHAIAHTDLHHARAEGTEEAAADEKTGEYLAKLGIRWPDIENMLARHIKDGLQRKSHLLKGYQKVNPPPIAKFTYKCRNTQTGAAECTEPCRVDFKSESTKVNSSTKYFWNGAESGPSHSLTDLRAGEHRMTLIVVNPDGQKSTYTQTVQVKKAFVPPPPPPPLKPTASFVVSPEKCAAPCQVTITNKSSNINRPNATIKWFINGEQIRYASETGFSYKFNKPGSYKIWLEIDNGNGQSDSASKTIEISKPSGVTKKRFSLELQPYASLPVGTYQDVNIFPSWRGDWNPEAGMANFGYGGEMAIGLNVLKFMSLRLQGGYVHNDYNTTALFFQLEDYELQTGQSLQEKFIESTGYRKAYYGASISIEPIPVESTFYLSLEPAYGQIIAPWENSTSVYYTKDDGQRWQTRLVYGLPENGVSSYWSGKIQMGVRWGEEDGQRPNLISLSGSFFYSNFATGVQSHSLGDNSQPLVITQSRIQAFHVGIGYRRWF
ncbi:MAG: hypothetical protein IAE84_01465 [Saprospiraceae bacterium]|nr:hypothetical protein [Saprospiraceae bacterium]